MARLRQHRRPLLVAALALIAIVALTACEDAPQNSFQAKSDAAERTLDLYVLVTAMASLVGVAVLGTLLFALWRFRARAGHVPTQTHGNTLLEVTWTLVPAALLLIIGIPSILVLVESDREPDEDALRITVTAHQWWWQMDYQGLGPDGGLLTTANELHVPLGQQVAITLESVDVIHSFWVPRLVGKADAIPNRQTKIEPFVPNEVGIFFGQCAEFCGSAHALMRFRVIVEPLADFERWVAALQEPPAPTGGLAARGQQLFFGAAGCIACHTIAGTIAQGTIGPDLSRFGARTTVGAGILENNDENVQEWIFDIRSIKPIGDEPRFMPSFGELPPDDPRRLTEADVTAITAYLRGMRVE